jgi:LAO/AO transport system kinase
MSKEPKYSKVQKLVEDLRHGSVNALAKLITLVENQASGAREALRGLYPRTGGAYVLGITGPPGSGKSTLTDVITSELRQRDLTVGIVAVDPSSAFSRGALLGDRLRMKSMSASDPGVFFRSMATRGSMGGLSRATSGAVELMDAYGMDCILIETVGVGQDELDIINTADTIVLISIPGLGDEIQAFKAGIMEIGDIYVVNKADRDGADQLVADLQHMRDLGTQKEEWDRPIVRTVAVEGKGIEELTEAAMAHRQYMVASGELLVKRQNRAAREVRNLVEHEIARCVNQTLADDSNEFDMAVKRIANRELDPYTYSEQIIAKLESSQASIN